jgi:hypothetical protein
MKGDDDYAGIFKEQHRQNHDWNDGGSSCWNNGMVMECYHGKGVLTGSFLFFAIFTYPFMNNKVQFHSYYRKGDVDMLNDIQKKKYEAIENEVKTRIEELVDTQIEIMYLIDGAIFEEEVEGGDLIVAQIFNDEYVKAMSRAISRDIFSDEK